MDPPPAAAKPPREKGDGCSARDFALLLGVKVPDLPAPPPADAPA